MLSPISEKLLAWYQVHARVLPWREDGDPYHIWIAEVMLQQTRVETVIPYYYKWLDKFPSINEVAQASLQEVLLTWEGLGYYGRARRIHEAAQYIISKHNGFLPSDIGKLKLVPGIGSYTAGAIASIAFHLDEPTLDGNIRRIYCRLFNIEEPQKSKEAEKKLWQISRDHLPPGYAGQYNQALMDLGATICTAKKPTCSQCPIGLHCQAKILGIQDQRPIKLERKQVPHFLVSAAIISFQNKVLIALRPKEGLLGGLWEFPGGKKREGETFADCLVREIQEELGIMVRVGESMGIFKHAYTHFRITLHAFHCSLADNGNPTALGVQDWRWVRISDLNLYPMGKIDRMISKQLEKSILC
jgi:A/G-specific adenine glycosylase